MSWREPTVQERAASPAPCSSPNAPTTSIPIGVAARIRHSEPHLSEAEANSQAWYQGKRLLQRAIAERLNFAFETTLGGNTIPALLSSALSAGLEVRVWYVGLSSVELHIARVRARVEKGGHPIPEPKIRDRYDRSRLNLIRLMPRLTELLVYDNSNEADPEAGERPEPKLLLHMASGKIIDSYDLQLIPEWAKPILAAALKIAGLNGGRGQCSHGGLPRDLPKSGIHPSHGCLCAGKHPRSEDWVATIRESSKSAMKLVGPLAARSPGLRLALALEIERHCSADEILQGRLIDLVAFVDVDGAPDIPVEAGVE